MFSIFKSILKKIEMLLIIKKNVILYNINIMSASSTNVSTVSSVYIPRVFSNIHPNVISQTFERQNIGIVDHIQVIQRPKKKGKCSAYMAFVYFKEWFTNQSALNLAERITDPEKQARVVYDDPYYWIILPNTTGNKGKSTTTTTTTINQKAVSSEVSPATSSSIETTEKMDTLYIMIQDLQDRVKHIEEYIYLLHKYNSLTNMPSSPVTHPDKASHYNYNYTVDSNVADEDNYTYSLDDEEDNDKDQLHPYAPIGQSDSPPTMIHVDSLGLVYKNIDEDDSRFWCDP